MFCAGRHEGVPDRWHNHRIVRRAAQSSLQTGGASAVDNESCERADTGVCDFAIACDKVPTGFPVTLCTVQRDINEKALVDSKEEHRRAQVLRAPLCVIDLPCRASLRAFVGEQRC